MSRRKAEYKPLLFTTTVRNPERMKGLLNVLSKYNNQLLNNLLAEKVMGDLIRYGLYRPTKVSLEIKGKWKGTKKGEFGRVILTNQEVALVVRNNPQEHKEADFDKGWPSRFATEFDFAKELGFVYFYPGKKIEFSEIGLKLANSLEVKLDSDMILVEEIHPELEQQAFLQSMAKYQRNNPFVRVLNNNAPLILLLEVIKKLNADKDFNSVGISKLELPLLLFWKNNNSNDLYQLIKSIRNKYRFTPTWEVIFDICVNKIMEGKLKKFSHKSIMIDYPDEFIRKMRITGLISLRGAGRFIDINKNEQKKVDYILDNYSKYKNFSTEKGYFDYMAKTDQNLFVLEGIQPNKDKKEGLLNKWVLIYKWEKIKDEITLLSKKALTKDEVLKYLSNSSRLEFLTALAVKSKFPNVEVIPNYPVDDEGLPTSTAGGIGDKGDIECHESANGVLLEVTMSEGRIQTVMEVWPISRHLEKFDINTPNSICYFIAPSIFSDSVKQIGYVKREENRYIYPKTIVEFVDFLETNQTLYSRD